MTTYLPLCPLPHSSFMRSHPAHPGTHLPQSYLLFERQGLTLLLPLSQKLCPPLNLMGLRPSSSARGSCTLPVSYILTEQAYLPGCMRQLCYYHAMGLLSHTPTPISQAHPQRKKGRQGEPGHNRQVLVSDWLLSSHRCPGTTTTCHLHLPPPPSQGTVSSWTDHSRNTILPLPQRVLPAMTTLPCNISNRWEPDFLISPHLVG